MTRPEFVRITREELETAPPVFTQLLLAGVGLIVVIVLVLRWAMLG